jgi:septum formation protein
MTKTSWRSPVGDGADYGVADRTPRLVLASASPRRADLLDSANLDFEVRPAEIDESVLPGESSTAYVRRLSIEKAGAIDIAPGEIVIAADTTVEIGGEILGKPIDGDDARRMLRLLGGSAHNVHTGVSIRDGHRTRTVVVTTVVEFIDLDDAAIDAYIATGEPFDKAGGYAIQGAGGRLVSGIEGSVSNVIGLPMEETLELLGWAVEN